MKSIYDDLKRLIDYINSAHQQITRIWNEQTTDRVNLSKCCVSDIALDGTIYKNIADYVKLLNEKSSTILLELSSLCSCQVTARVKTQNSIELKIQNYNSSTHEYGKVPVNKCINDLFGVRIILSSVLSHDEILNFINETYGGKYKCINSSKLEYKATHIYFKEDNYSFQWELQIWNIKDQESNFESHRKHKQAYTTWEKESKEGGIINDETLHNNE